MINPSDRRTHIERINDAKEEGMNEEQLQRLMAHISSELEPVRRAAEMQIAYMERELADRDAFDAETGDGPAGSADHTDAGADKQDADQA